MEDRIIEIMKDVFNTEHITPATTQMNCEKWDSLRHLNLVIELENEYDIELEPEEISGMTSVKFIENIISRKL